MNKTQNMNWAVDSWIDEEELPVKANLKVIRKNHPNYSMTQEQIDDRNEFIRCYILQGFESLLMIPKPVSENDFFIENFEESAFNTVDFQTTLRPFNKYSYAIEKTMERVKDLAIMHSSLTSPERRTSVYRQYEAFINSAFRNQLSACVERFQKACEERRWELRRKIAELNRRIIECNRIWEQYAPPENWDR